MAGKKSTNHIDGACINIFFFHMWLFSPNKLPVITQLIIIIKRKEDYIYNNKNNNNQSKVQEIRNEHQLNKRYENYQIGENHIVTTIEEQRIPIR